MRTFSKLLACSALAVASMNAAVVSFNSNDVNGVFSSGFDAANTLLAGGAVDPHYTLIYLPAGCGGLACQETSTAGDLFGPSSYVVLGPNGTYPLNGTAWVSSNDANSQWIGPRADQNNPVVGGATFPNVGVYASDTDFYVYRMVFNLTAMGLNPATANIQLAWLSDNSNNAGAPLLTSHIRMCSVGSASDPVCAAGSMVTNSGNAGQGSPTLTTVNITSGFSGGLMALDFVIYNSVIPAPQLNPSGFRVDIITATADNVPEPTTFGLIGLGLAGLYFTRRK